MTRFMIAGNWKMNLLPSQVSNFCAELGKQIKSPLNNVDVCLAMPATHLFLAKELGKTLAITVAAQNVHWEASGAFTGEISMGMLQDLSVSSTLIGHSERRQYYNETSDDVALKFVSCLKAGVQAIVCCGETLAEREGGLTQQVIEQQLAPVLAKATKDSQFVIAYEPVWAIGTGLTASEEQAQEAHAFIRQLLSKSLGAPNAAKLKILYGGSAKPSNIKGLLEQPDIDGALIGGASLKPEDFAAMINTAIDLAN